MKLQIKKKRVTIEEAEKILLEARIKANKQQEDIIDMLMAFIKYDLPNSQGAAIAWRTGLEFKEQHWDNAGMEPAEAILMFDQLHHRVQHQGLDK